MKFTLFMASMLLIKLPVQSKQFIMFMQMAWHVKVK